MPRAIEVGFPIVEINRLAVPERNSFKPIYQMHKWFARRASCVFRAILLGALKPAFKQDGSPTDLMEEFYKDHTNDPDTAGKTVLDPFMGGGTTVVEALRLGCTVTGIDLNPVAWFIVKSEVEPVDLEKLKAAFESLAERPVAWNGGKPLRETLLDLYKTEAEPGIEADVIYTFWVKHAVCTDPNCKREVPLFGDFIIARKTPTVRYHPDVTCLHCRKVYDWEIEVGSLIADPAVMVNASRGSAGDGRPTQLWSYASPPVKKQEPAIVECPHCRKSGSPKLKSKKAKRKKVPLTVLLCPECEAVWQWRGELPEGEVQCPACKHDYDPRKGNVPDKGKFLCKCGNVDKIIESIRRLPKDQRLPVRPYAIQAYLATNQSDEDDEENPQMGLLGEQKRPIRGKARRNHDSPQKLLLPKNGKFFTRFTPSDKTRLQQGEVFWERNKEKLPFPKSKIPRGAETGRLIEHHYNYWHEMFFPRQLLALSTLLKGIMAEPNGIMREVLLSVFMMTTEANNQFTWQIKERSTPGGTAPGGVLRRHDFAPKSDICEQNVWGIISGNNTFTNRWEMLMQAEQFAREVYDLKITGAKTKTERSISGEKFQTPASANLLCSNSGIGLPVEGKESMLCITDPPYVGNVNYAELSDFFYVWLRLALKESHPNFAPEYTPKAEEIIANPTRGKSIADFFSDLTQSFSRIHGALHENGILVFTFHHTDAEGKIWEGLLQTLCDTDFEIFAVYPIHGEREASLHLLDKENISYDLIHVCRKRQTAPETRSWAGIRQEVRKKARVELKAIEDGRYGKEPLGANDVRLICIGKCLELYSRHYGKVVDHEGNEFRLHEALQDIGTIVDQLVTRERPLPPELEEDVDPISYAWLRVLLETKMEINVNELSKSLRAMQVNVEDLKKAGLIVKGRTGRGRYFKVKQPDERLNALKEKLEPSLTPAKDQMPLFDAMSRPVVHNVNLVDLVQLLIGLAWAGESVAPWLERFSHMRPKVRAALRFIRDRRRDWKEYIDRVLNIVEGAPLFSDDPSRQKDEVEGATIANKRKG
jgi:adenine-specific DNA methylase